MAIFQHTAGILLHPTSLPQGTLHEDALRWLDFMHHSGLSVWQMLPLGIPHQGLSPYDCQSAFAVNPALFDQQKLSALSLTAEQKQHFYHITDYWLDDFALYRVLKKHYHQQAWFDWPDPYKKRDPDALNAIKLQYQDSIEQEKEAQCHYYYQWQIIRHYAQHRNITLFGDIPMFVALDSADVWAHQEQFLLDSEGQAIYVTGVPPDYFSPTGQRWGNPHYNWENMQKDQFRWWQQRIEHHLAWFDILRIDHFRGLESSWYIPAKNTTAIEGTWKKIPGAILLQHLQTIWNPLPLVAEDLGIITPEVSQLRQQFSLPGMRILQFGFDGKIDNPHLAINIQEDNIAYTGTHDNDTTMGWFNMLDPDAQAYILAQLQTLPHITATMMPWLLIDAALSCKAQLAIIPLQDFLGLNSSHRMNTPGTIENNWQWKFQWSDISDDLIHTIYQRMEQYQRL